MAIQRPSPSFAASAIARSKMPHEHTTPQILQQTTALNSVEYLLQIPADLLYFEGHFSDCPILPGVVQIKWVVDMGAAFVNLGTFVGMNKVKFTSPILPQMVLRLSLRTQPDRGNLIFRFYNDKKEFSSGELIFE